MLMRRTEKLLGKSFEYLRQGEPVVHFVYNTKLLCHKLILWGLNQIKLNVSLHPNVLLVTYCCTSLFRIWRHRLLLWCVIRIRVSAVLRSKISLDFVQTTFFFFFSKTLNLFRSRAITSKLRLKHFVCACFNTEGSWLISPRFSKTIEAIIIYILYPYLWHSD